MKLYQRVLLATVVGASVSFTASADMGVVKILTPADNAQFDANEEYPMTYEIVLGDGGDHFHVWVDEAKSPAQHSTKGTYTLPKLSPGKHVINIKVVDKGHVPTGPEATIHVVAK